VRQAAPRAPEKEVYRAPVKLVRNASNGQVEYDSVPNVMAQPTTGNHLGLRSSGRSAEPASGATSALADLPSDQSYLDIPAFLRRQAD